MGRMEGKEREGTSPSPWRNSFSATPTLTGWSSRIRPLLLDICRKSNKKKKKKKRFVQL